MSRKDAKRPIGSDDKIIIICTEEQEKYIRECGCIACDDDICDCAFCGCNCAYDEEEIEFRREFDRNNVNILDGAKIACSLILETLKDQRFEILDSKTENYEIALKTVDESIKSVEDRLNKYNSHR
jgi:hypothetical protein